MVPPPVSRTASRSKRQLDPCPGPYRARPVRAAPDGNAADAAVAERSRPVDGSTLALVGERRRRVLRDGSPLPLRHAADSRSGRATRALGLYSSFSLTLTNAASALAKSSGASAKSRVNRVEAIELEHDDALKR